ncbi:uncharacterized protein LOC110232513 [Exaiptasia diaphana]|uniref:Coiled-coil protein 142 C-terminal domain-containing protein n=1 Tax=Exaiptasia diaphana TaxID=2652724 RepID=A0A913WSE3_EXADI|nr:uncharacterized protein LOC110232513 [Exaiptasia diaphana]KXJ18387.1 Coiled-coil domain-containing protein 142 [Exaiptasia diaphana]
MDKKQDPDFSPKVGSSMSNECYSTAGHGKIEQPVFQRDDFRGILPLEIEKNVSALQESFKSVRKVVCLCPAKRSSKVDFGHFQPGTRICSSVKQIEKRIEERVGLTLVRNCLSRLQASCRFTSELESIMEYYLTYLKDLHNRGSNLEREFNFKGHRFHELCLTAKDHLTFWSVFLERCSKEYKFKSIFSPLERDIKSAHKSLLRVICRFQVMISTILVYVLNIAYSLKWVLSDCLLKDISSAIEDLNRLSEYSKSIQDENDVIFKTRSTSLFSDTTTCRVFGVCASVRLNSVDTSVSLQRLFNDTAKRRARIFGSHLLSFLHEQDDICHCLKNDLIVKRGWRDFDQRPQGTNCYPSPSGALSSFPSSEHQFITELISKLATSMTLMSSYGMDKKLLMHKSLPQKGLYHKGADEQQTAGDGIPPEEHPSEPEGASHSILKHSPGTVSPRLSKRVQWHHSIDVDVKAQVSILYMDILWSSMSVTICQMLELLSWERDVKGIFGPLPLWSDSILLSVVTVLESVALSDSMAPEESKCLQLVGRCIRCYGCLSSWDKGFCKLLSVARKDKCSTSSQPEDNSPSCETVLSMMELCSTLRDFFQVAQKWDYHLWSTEYSSMYMIKDLSSSVLPFLSRMQALLSFARSWFDTKLYHFLSGWNLSSFFMLVHTDMPLLIELAHATMKTIKPLCVGQGGNYSWGSLPIQLEDLQGILKAIQGMNNLYRQLFKDDLSKMCSEFFQEAMPIGKSWKKSRQSGIPCKHNSYVEHAITQILEPVISGTELLSNDCRLSLLSLTTTTMMETWSTYVLKEEIVFSFYGAQQLQLDFNYIKCWISSDVSTLNTNMQSSLLGLEIFHHLDGATRLLMLQPRKKKQMDELDVELESNISAVSSSSVLSSFSGVDIDSYEMDVLNDKTIPNKQLWLDLRLRGGKSKKGLLPFCLKVQEMK